MVDVADDHDWDFEGTVGLEEVERVGVRQRLRDLQNSCHVKCRKVSGNDFKAGELANELV